MPLIELRTHRSLNKDSPLRRSSRAACSASVSHLSAISMKSDLCCEVRAASANRMHSAALLRNWSKLGKSAFISVDVGNQRAPRQRFVNDRGSSSPGHCRLNGTRSGPSDRFGTAPHRRLRPCTRGAPSPLWPAWDTGSSAAWIGTLSVPCCSVPYRAFQPVATWRPAFPIASCSPPWPACWC
jgi:hypothetical protein